jgi:multiple sugar transport system substrate-binding protein
VTDDGFTRRGFLRLAGGALAATAVGCNSGSGTATSKAGTASTTAGAKGPRQLRIAQWSHYVAGYDQWWDEAYTKGWGERNGIEVVVDHFDINQALGHADAEVAAQRGHDLFHLKLASPAPLQDQVIDHREIIEEVEAKVGKMVPFVERSIFNPKTRTYFAFSDSWEPNPVHFRMDLWEPVGRRPDTWDDVLAGGARLKAQGHPVGIGMGGDPESNLTLLGLMHGYGASIQDEQGTVVINSRGTVEAVKVGAAVLREAMTPDVFGWDITSNNRYLISGRASLIVNPIAAVRALEAQDPALAAKVQLLPAPSGSHGRLSVHGVSTYVIWKFSENQEAAKRFLVDLATAYREPFLQSQYLQIPSFPGAIGDFAALVANDTRSQPPGKYRLLADVTGWMTNLGHPGHTNAANDEVVKASIISQMFATAARGEMSPEEAVKAAEAKIKPIYDKWREQGKI